MGRIIELTKPNRSLHKERGFLAIREGGETIGRVPLDDIDAVIAATPGLYWSGNALAALAERSIPVVFTGQNFTPVSHLLPLAAHHAQGAIMQTQADASLPLRKRLWMQIVKAKIKAQEEALALTNKPIERLVRLQTQVRSGDPDNREAAAAQYYWPKLFGKEFRRNREQNGANAMLNYGYTVLRASTARAIVAAGLNPSLSLHHASNSSALRLADDLMEPFRPLIDIIVLDLLNEGYCEIEPIVKQRLVGVLSIDYETENGYTPLSHVLVLVSQSLAAVYQKKEVGMNLPLSLRPLHYGENR